MTEMRKSRAVYKTREGAFFIIDIPKAVLWKAKAIGVAMNDEPNTLLIEITSIIDGVIEEKGDLPGIKGVYDSLNRILYEMISSRFYNFIPDRSTGDGYEYYEERLQEIRMQIQRDFLGNKRVKKKLQTIVDEMSGFIKSYSIPDGIPERWMELNPRLRFFDSAYDFYEENRELYDDIAGGKYSFQGRFTIGFCTEVTEESATERRKYFEELQKKYEKRKEQFEEDKVLRDELIDTLELVFETEFEEVL